jgi:hypothetical protein
MLSANHINLYNDHIHISERAHFFRWFCCDILNVRFDFDFCVFVRSLTVCLVLIVKANEMHSFSNLFDKVLYIFRTGRLSIIRSISTLYSRSRYLSCLFCWRLLTDLNTVITQ